MCVRLPCVCECVCVLLLLLFGSSFPFTRIFLPVLFAPGLAFFAYHHHPSKVCFCFLLGSSVAPPPLPSIPPLVLPSSAPPLAPQVVVCSLVFLVFKSPHITFTPVPRSSPSAFASFAPQPLSDHRATSLCALLPPSPSSFPLRTLSYINLKFLCLG